MGWFSRPKAPNYKPLAEAQKEAARLQHEAAMAGIEAWKEQNALTRKDFQPYREHGIAVMQELKAGLDSGRWKGEEWKGTGPLPTFDPTSVDVTEDPGYQFRLEEGLKAVRRGAAAGSGARSGATMKALTRYGQGMASQEYRAAYDRAVGRYMMDTQRALSERQHALQDWQIGQGVLHDEYGRLMDQARLGLDATARGAGFGAQAVGAQAQLRGQGAAAIGAGQIGAQQAIIQQQLVANQYKQQSFNNLMSTLGVAAGAAGAFSDRRLKENIKRIGHADNGLPIYAFNLKGGSQTTLGFMADEVEAVHPEAVGEIGGYKTVDYRAATAPVGG